MAFHGARLVRVLARLAAPGVPESRQSLAERLGDWLSVTDALTLSLALGSPASGNAGEPGAAIRPDPGRADAAAAARGARDRLRHALESAASGFDASASDFPSYRRHHQRMQREMSLRIAPLRRALRAALAARSADLARLAALDAVFEQALAERERGLLASAPVLVGRRFDQLRGTSDGWLATFHDDFRETLAAELELRLQPLDGLIAALDDEATRMQ